MHEQAQMERLKRIAKLLIEFIEARDKMEDLFRKLALEAIPTFDEKQQA